MNCNRPARITGLLANEATKGRNAEILDTLAATVIPRWPESSGRRLQQQAVTFARGRRKTQFQETLDSYKAGHLPKAY